MNNKPIVLILAILAIGLLVISDFTNRQNTRHEAYRSKFKLTTESFKDESKLKSFELCLDTYTANECVDRVYN